MQDKYSSPILASQLFDNFSLFFSTIFSLLVRSKQNKFDNFFGISIDIQNADEQIEYIHELNCSEVSIKFLLSNVNKLSLYKDLLLKIKNKNITIVIIQNIHNIDNKLLKLNLGLIFSGLKGICKQYQIGTYRNNEISRLEDIEEYMNFYTIAQSIRDDKFKNYKLIAKGTKNLNLKHVIKSLFNNYVIRYDKFSFIFNNKYYPECSEFANYTLNKHIDTIYGLCSFSKKSTNKIIINGVFCDIKSSKNSDKCLLNEEKQANNLVRYHLLSLGTKKIQSIFYSGLLSSKYGLMYLHQGKIKKRKAFDAYKHMIKLIDKCEVNKYTHSNKLHVLTITNNQNKKIDIVWIEDEDESVILEGFNKVYDIYGKELIKNVKITNSPIYAYHLN